MPGYPWSAVTSRCTRCNRWARSGSARARWPGCWTIGGGGLLPWGHDGPRPPPHALNDDEALPLRPRGRDGAIGLNAVPPLVPYPLGTGRRRSVLLALVAAPGHLLLGQGAGH